MQPYNDNMELTCVACKIGSAGHTCWNHQHAILLCYNDATTPPQPISGDFSGKIEHFQINKLYVCINGDDGVLALK